MTALKPTEDGYGYVRGVASTRYPLNKQCAMPTCTEPAQSAHHLFPRSFINGDSWFVEIRSDGAEEKQLDRVSSKGIPHVIGLCGDGTRGHHGDLEEHRSWVKLEDEGFVWYDRVPPTDPHDEIPAEWQEWVRVGLLNPPPGSVEGKPKRKRTLKGTAERAARKTVSVRLPEGVDGDDWDELVEEAERVELAQPDTAFDPARGSITVGKLLVVVLERFTGRAG